MLRTRRGAGSEQRECSTRDLEEVLARGGEVFLLCQRGLSQCLWLVPQTKPCTQLGVIAAVPQAAHRHPQQPHGHLSSSPLPQSIAVWSLLCFIQLWSRGCSPGIPRGSWSSLGPPAHITPREWSCEELAMAVLTWLLQDGQGRVITYPKLQI